MQQSLFFQLKQKQGGFTLVELMVSVALFSIVVTVSMGTLITMIDANNKAQALYSVMTNISFAVDSMTRNIRTGNTYYCSNNIESITSDKFQDGSNAIGNCSNPGKVLLFTRETDSRRAGYKLESNAIYQYNSNGAGGGSWQQITAGDVVISRLEFRVYDTTRASDGGPGGNDKKQARVAIFIEGEVEGIRGTGSKFAIQTSVPQQVLDY